MKITLTAVEVAQAITEYVAKNGMLPHYDGPVTVDLRVKFGTFEADVKPDNPYPTKKTP